jgi:transposase
MENQRVSLTKPTLKVLKEMLRSAEYIGDLRTVRKVNAILAIADGYSYSVIADILNVCTESIRLWFAAFLQKGPDGLRSSKPPGRPAKLTKTQKKELDEIITNGPVEAGYPGACWRSPMIQHLILEKFGVFYSVIYIVQLLKNMGFSYQKARFVSDHKDPEKRKEWLENTWPEIMKIAKEKAASILFGDEASFPQWGTLTYTWAKRGEQPTVKTSGIRKGYKVFGLIDYFTGRLFYQGYEGRLTSESYSQFLKSVLDKAQQHIILVQDGARYHTSKAMQQFFAEHKERLTVYPLPSYSPDYNPIEKLWKEIKKDGTHLHYFPTFQDLITKVEEVLLTFATDASQKILSLFGMYQELSSTIEKAA